MAGLYDVVGYWQEIGIYDILLPFVLIFTISFAILQKIKLFGKSSKNINAVVALVIAMLFLQNTYLIFLLQKFLPNVSIILVIFIMFLLLFGVFSGPRKFTSGSLGLAFMVALGAIVIALLSDVFYPGPVGPYGSGGGVLGLYYSLDPGMRAMLFTIVLGAMFIWFVMGDDKKEGKGFGKKFGDFVESIKEES